MKKSILMELNNDLNFVKKIYGEENVLGIFNYDILENKSEAIIIPTFEEVCLHDDLIQYVYSYNGHTVKATDVRYIYRATANGYPEIIDSLYTEYVLINPRYEHIYEKLLKDKREEIKEGIAADTPSDALELALMKICRAAWNEGSKAVQFIKQITDAEKLALEGIVNAVGDEGVFSQAKVASAVGVSRLTMTNLVAKMNEFGVAETQNHGRAGTYIKIIDDTLLNIRGYKLI